jgi:bifunctional non-homologous end joining protein LigD
MARIYAPCPCIFGRTTSTDCWRRPDRIFIAPFEDGEIDPRLFPEACKFGLEGFVSKRRDSLYRAGPSKHWVKVKNPKHPTMNRVKQSFS